MHPSFGDEESPLIQRQQHSECQSGSPDFSGSRGGAGGGGEICSNRNRSDATPTPLPKLQMFTLCFVRMTDPLAFTQVFPYINEMIRDIMHLQDNPSQIGFYSGLVESIFSFSQVLVIYHWTKISDAIGRKPVIIAGLLGIALSTLAFGVSPSLTSILISRAAAGIFAGNVAVVQSVLGELTDETNQNVALPLYGLCWPFGAIVGPLLGGSFSHAARKFPSLGERIPLLTTYPYLLPCIVAALVTLLAAIFSWVFLEETLPSKRKQGHQTPDPNMSSVEVQRLFTPTDRPRGPYSYGSFGSSSASTLVSSRSSSEDIRRPFAGVLKADAKLWDTTDEDGYLSSSTAHSPDPPRRPAHVRYDTDMTAYDSPPASPCRSPSFDEGMARCTSPVEDEARSIDDPARYTVSMLLSLKSIKSLCIHGFALSFLDGAFAVVFVLFCFSPLDIGGLAFSSSQIGYALSLAGLSTTLLQFFFIPVILRNATYERCVAIHMFTMWLWPIVFGLMPILNMIARQQDGVEFGKDGYENGTGELMSMLNDGGVGAVVEDQARSAILWFGIALCLLLSKIASAGFPMNIVLTKMASPSPAALGCTNGVVQFAICFARAISPAFVSLLFSVSSSYPAVLGGQAWVVLMVGLSLLPVMILPGIAGKESVEDDDSGR